MGSNIAGFANGFIKKVNRNFEEAKMARYEQFIHDQEQADLKLTRDEEQRIDQEKATDLAAVNAAAATALATAQGGLNTQQAGFDIEATRLADEKDFDAKLSYVMQLYPGLPEDLAKTWAEGDISYITNMARDQRVFLPEERRFNTIEEATLLRAQTMAGTMRPGNLAPGTIYENTDWYNKVVQSIVQGRPIDELAEDGWRQELVRNEAGQVIDVQAVFTDPNMYAPDQNEYNNLTKAANTVLSVINTMTPDDLILDSEGNILQGDMRIAFHNLEQLASDLYVKGKGRMRENRAVDEVFTKERLDLLAQLTDTRMELPNYFLALASDPASIESMTLDIQAMDDVDELLDIYNNLFARKELHRQEILPADEVAIDAVLLAISNNPTLMEFREAQKAEAAAAGVPEPEDISRDQLPEDVQGIITIPRRIVTGVGRQRENIASLPTYELDDIGMEMMALAVQAQQAAPPISARNPMQPGLLKFVLEQFKLPDSSFGIRVARQLIESYRK